MQPDEAIASDAAIEAAIDDYQRSERPRLREHFQTMNALHNMEQITFEGRRWLTEHHLKERGADEHLDRLVEKGCDRGYLLDLLGMMDSNYLPPRWLGFDDRDELKRALTKLRDAQQIVGLLYGRGRESNRLTFLANDERMASGNSQQGDCRTIGMPTALFPVLQESRS